MVLEYLFWGWNFRGIPVPRENPVCAFSFFAFLSCSNLHCVSVNKKSIMEDLPGFSQYSNLREPQAGNRWVRVPRT